MHGIHDLGGMHGFGRVDVERDEPVFHARWEARILGIVYQLIGNGWVNVDAFRYGIERIRAVDYLTLGYYGRWRASVERLLAERGVLGSDEVEARTEGYTTTPPPPPEPPRAPEYGYERAAATPPRFAVGDAVRTSVANPAGHTRSPRYVAGRRGVVSQVYAACVFPDSNAHGRGENPQHLYNVRFDGAELWGADAEPGTALHIDLFEPYLEPA
jgi:nitrile hydratase beta subunit